MSLPTSNTPGGITTNIEHSAMPTLRQLMPNSCRTMFTEDSTCFNWFPVSYATSCSPTSSIQCRLAFLNIYRTGYSTSWRRTKGSTSTMQCGYSCLITTSSQQNISHMRKFLNGMGMSQYLLGVVTQSLRNGSPAQSPIFNCAIECTRALLELYMYARYKSHDYATLSYMEDALHRCHTLKDVFLLGRAGKQANAKANAQRMEIVKKRNVDEETNAETWTPSKKLRKLNAWRDYISHKLDVSKELDDHFNLQRIHLMSHWV